MTGNLNSGFYDGKAAENSMIFPMSVFLIIDVFPPFLEKNRATSPPESRTHLFSTQELRGGFGTGRYDNVAT